MEKFKEFETVLMQRLNAQDTDNVFLKSASSAIVKLKKQGLEIDQVYIKGKPRPERVIINGTVDPEFWGKFREVGGQFKKFEVFPYGILNPEGFRFKATIEGNGYM